MKLLKSIALAALILIAACAIYGYWYYNSLQPTYEGTLTLKELKEPVDVYFDDFGIPHIYAQNEHDAQFALGYLHAQDRLWQIELLRRVGSGRLSEILGEATLKTDKFFRTVNSLETAKKAKANFDKIPADDPIKKAALAYYAGLNAFIKNGPTPVEFQILGIEKEELTLLDCYSTFGYMAFSFAQAFRTDPIVAKIHQEWGEEYLNDLDVHWNPDAQIIPTYTAPKEVTSSEMSDALSMNELFESLPTPPWIGSNSWIISGQKTKSGKTIFTNDTHIGFAQPSVWWEAHVEYPGHRSYGNYLAGIPFPVIGHNDYCAIGLTMFENDDIDFYIEKLNPDNPNQVAFKDGWEDLNIRKEVIKVKGGADVEIEVKTSRHGPIMNDVVAGIPKVTDQPVAAYWVYNDLVPNSLSPTYKLAHAQSMDEARIAASEIIAPGLNGMYADRDGNIAWWAMGKLPIRPDHVNTKLFLDGASGKDEILGYEPFENNPKSENPPEGYVYSANNQPDTTNGVLQEGYYIPEDRAKRIMDLLSAKDDWDVPAAKEMITEVVSDKKPMMVQQILDVLRNTEFSNQHTGKAVEILAAWNGDNQLDDIAPTIFAKLQCKLLELTCKDEVGDNFTEFLNTVLSRRSLPFLLAKEDSPWWDDQTTTDKKESRKDIFKAALEQSLEEISAQLGDDITKWKWGKVHTIEHPHTLGQNENLRPYFNVGPFPVIGNKEVINNMSYTINGTGKYEVVSGPAIRRIIDFSDVEHSWNVLPTGNSGNVLSPHYDDQAQLFVNGEFRSQLMNREEIMQLERKLVLESE
ncbi:MAG: penicillin acylase family protein [Bacteroidota bacterium]